MDEDHIPSILAELWDEVGKPGANAFLSMTLFLALGFLFASYFLRFDEIEFFKLLNLTGIAFDAVGLVMLSSFFLRHKAFQAFVNNSIYPYALGLLIFIPVGAFAAVMDAGAKDGVSNVAALSLLALSIAVFSSGLIFDVVVVVAKRWRGRSIRYKSQLIGSFYLLNGLLFQFVGAYFDLVS